MASELEVFVLVAESGGFGSAARRLRLTPSAVSRRVAQLEDRVGVQLLTRTTRKVELTQAGEIYFNRIRPLLQAIGAATVDLARHDPAPSGRLVVGAPAALIERVLVPGIGRYLAAHPQMAVELLPVEQVVDQAFDFVVQSLPSTAPQQVSIELAANPWIICASPDYLARRGTPMVPDDLARHDCLLIASHPLWQFVQDFSEISIAPPARFVSFGSGVRSAAVAGLGIARLATFLIRDDLATGRLVEVLGAVVQPPGRTLFAVADADKMRLTKFATFGAFLKEVFAADADQDDAMNARNRAV